MGSGCGTVGRAGTFKTGGPGFEYIHQHKQTLWAVVVAHQAQQSRRTPEGLGLNPSIGFFYKEPVLTAICTEKTVQWLWKEPHVLKKWLLTLVPFLLSFTMLKIGKGTPFASSYSPFLAGICPEIYGRQTKFNTIIGTTQFHLLSFFCVKMRLAFHTRKTVS